jgi:predicted nucleic acid-binding protein
MSGKTQAPVNTTSKPSLNADRSGLLQRKCACGNSAGMTGKCTSCQQEKLTVQRQKTDSKDDVAEVPAIVHEFHADRGVLDNNSSLRRMPMMQAKLMIGESDDPLEREADRVADQVLAAPVNSTVSTAPPRIQRFTGQASGGAGMVAPASVESVLSSPGSPLEAALQQDMGQRFGHDFSSVRVHTDVAAELSAQDVNAKAYTVGHNIVFGAGNFAPQTHEGQRLIAHELTHVVQQSGSYKVLSPLQGFRVQRVDAPSQQLKPRLIFLDTNVILEIEAGNKPAEERLSELQKEGAIIRLPKQVQNELLNQHADPTVSQQTLETIRRLKIDIAPSSPGSLDKRVQMYERNIVDPTTGKLREEVITRNETRTKSVLSEPDLLADTQKKGQRNDVLVAAEVKAAGGELWTFDADYMVKGKEGLTGPKKVVVDEEKGLGVKIIPESWKIKQVRNPGGKGGTNQGFSRTKQGVVSITEPTQAGQQGVVSITKPTQASQRGRAAATASTQSSDYEDAQFEEDAREELLNHWRGKLKRARKPETKARYQKYIETLEKGTRPSWQQSEAEMRYFYGQIGSARPKIFKDGRKGKMVKIDERWRPEKGSTVPDIVISSAMLEVKNYDIKNRSSLLKKLETQIASRNRQGDANLKQQGIILDFRGQNVNEAEIQRLVTDIEKRTGVPTRNIQIVRWKTPPSTTPLANSKQASKITSEKPSSPAKAAPVNAPRDPKQPESSSLTPNKPSSPAKAAPVNAPRDPKQPESSSLTPNKSSSPAKAAPVNAPRDPKQPESSSLTPNKSSSPAKAAPVNAPRDLKQPESSEPSHFANIDHLPTAPTPRRSTIHTTARPDGSITVNVNEILGSSPAEYTVTVQVMLGGTLSASANQSGTRGTMGANASVSGSVTWSHTYAFSEQEKNAYLAAVNGNTSSSYQEIAAANLWARGNQEQAKTLLSTLGGKSPSVEMILRLRKGESQDFAAAASAQGGFSGSAKAVSLGVSGSASMQNGWAISHRQSRYFITRSFTIEKGKVLEGDVSVGLLSMGYAADSGTTQSTSVNFVVVEDDPDVQAKLATITAIGSIEELGRLAINRKDLGGSVTTTKGTSSGGTLRVGAGDGVVSLEGHQQGIKNDSVTRDAEGNIINVYEGGTNSGLSLKSKGHTVASVNERSTIRSEVNQASGKATGETLGEKSESDLTASAKYFASHPLASAQALYKGDTQALLKTTTVKTGANLEDDNYTRLWEQSKDENIGSWRRAGIGLGGDNLDAWMKLRPSIKRSGGNRTVIAQLLQDFKTEGDDRRRRIIESVSDIGSGNRFEFPDSIKDQKEVFDSIVVNDPTNYANELLGAGKMTEALAELKSIDARLDALRTAINTHAGEIQPAILPDMNSRVSKRKAQVRMELTKLTPANKPVTIKPGAPAPEKVDETEKQNADRKVEIDGEIKSLIASLKGFRTNENAKFGEVEKLFRKGIVEIPYLNKEVRVSNPSLSEILPKLGEIQEGYKKWDPQIESLKALYRERGENPDQTNQYAPNRPKWNELNTRKE